MFESQAGGDSPKDVGRRRRGESGLVWKGGVSLALAAVFLFPGAALADQLDSGDTAWMLTSTALVLFMTIPGLALFYGGLVRT